MPQMAPLSWLILFLIFSITFIIFNLMNYFMFLPFTPKSFLKNKELFNSSLNWKW